MKNKLTLSKQLFSVLVSIMLVTTIAVGVTSCGEPQNTEAHGITILSSAKNVEMDPAKSQNLNITNLSLILRRLTGWEVPTDGSPTKVVPDLASALGESSDGGKTWIYHIKEGVKFETGAEITAQDIKWGLERSFADELTGGLTLHKDLLVGGSAYKGPFSGNDLESIETPNTKTIVFRLERPYADWDWIASTPAFSPVPNGTVETGTYGRHPVASGPYKIASYEAGIRIVYDKNPYWDKSTDTQRAGEAPTITTELQQSADVATDRLLADVGSDQYAFASSNVSPQKLPQIKANPEASKRLVTSVTGGMFTYLALNVNRPQLKDVRVRQALQYAVDKNAFRIAKGGEIAGDFASTLIVPSIQGYEDYNLYEADPSGDVTKARALLAEAGVDPEQLELKLVTADDAAHTSEAQAIAQGIERLGVKVILRPYDSETLEDLITSGTDADFDLTISGWQPDIPSANSSIQPLFDSSQIGHGNYNISHFSSAQIDQDIKNAQQEFDKDKASALWGEIDKKILEQSPIVPLIYGKNTWLIGSKLDNFYIGGYPSFPNYLKITTK